MSCCVPGCKVRFEDGVPLHRFPSPKKEIERFRVWVLRVGGDIIGLTNEVIVKNRRVCHRHFEERFFYPKNRLSKMAIPTLHLSMLHLPGDTSCSTGAVPSYSTSAVPSCSTGAVPSCSTSAVPSCSTSAVPSCSTSAVPSCSTSAVPSCSTSAVPSCSTSAVPSCSTSAVPSCSTSAVPSCSTSTVRTRTLRSLSEDEMKMTRTIKMLQKNMRYLIKQKNSYKKRLLLSRKIIKTTSFDSFSKKMSKTAKTFVQMQLTQSGKRMRGRRFTLKQKILALSLYKSSPKAYRVLSQICILPKRKTLQCLLQKIRLTPGINRKMFDNLTKQVKKMPEHHKYCAIIFDEMAISPHLDLAGGKIVGFIDDGEKREPVIADHVLVFMVRGVIKKFKQPVHYSFCAGTTKTQHLKIMLKKVIEEVQACGLKVVATVCDQGVTNMAAINALKSETRAQNLRAEKENNDSCFEIGGKTIVPLYDPPHLLKGVRNNLLTKDLVYTMHKKKCVAKWQHLIDLYVRSPGYRGVRLVPKLTEHHVMPQLIPKMRVKYSTQVFSRTVGVALGFMAESGKLPISAKETADILIFFDDVFDSVNGSYSQVQGGKVYRSAVTPKSRHHQLWIDSIPVLKSMKYINKDGKASVVPSLSSWIKTIEGFQLLCRHMFQLGQTSLLLRHFNQDPLENFFGAIRAHGQSNIMPTAAAFQAAYKTLLVNNMSSAHSVGANCEKDKNKCLQNIKNMIEEEKEEKQKEHELTMEDLNIRQNDIVASNSPHDVERCAAVGYCSGWLVRNAKKNVYKGCTTCKTQLESEEKQTFHEFIKVSEYEGKDWLCYPTMEAFNMFLEIENIVMDILSRRSYVDCIVDYIKLIVSVHIDFRFLSCDRHKNQLVDYFINKNVTFCIQNWCKEINKILCGKSRNLDVNDPIKTAAQNHFLKNKLKKRKRASGITVNV